MINVNALSVTMVSDPDLHQIQNIQYYFINYFYLVTVSVAIIDIEIHVPFCFPLKDDSYDPP